MESLVRRFSNHRVAGRLGVYIHLLLEARSTVGGPKLACERSMNPMALPAVYLSRQGQTVWSLTGQHTGDTDAPPIERGQCNARRLGDRMAALVFANFFVSPSLRPARTCELAGFGNATE